MVSARQRRRHRFLATVTIWTLAMAGVLVVDLRLLAAAWSTVRAAHEGAAGFEELVSAVALVVLATAASWLCVAVTACLVAECGRLGARLTGGAAAALAPRRLRLLVRLACGVAVAAPLGALPAGAAEPAGCDSIACASAPAGLPVPDRPDVTSTSLGGPPARPTATKPPPTTPSTPMPTVVTVQRGDSLWSIAAAHLPRHVDAAEVAAAWPRWYDANRAVIGSDPDLILPGTELIAPGDPSPPS